MKKVKYTPELGKQIEAKQLKQRLEDDQAAAIRNEADNLRSENYLTKQGGQTFSEDLAKGIDRKVLRTKLR